MALKQRPVGGGNEAGSLHPHSCQLGSGLPPAYLHITPIKVHPSDHAALGCHVRPVNHLLSVVKVQGDGVVEALH